MNMHLFKFPLSAYTYIMPFCFQQQNASLTKKRSANREIGRSEIFPSWPRHPKRQGKHFRY